VKTLQGESEFSELLSGESGYVNKKGSLAEPFFIQLNMELSFSPADISVLHYPQIWYDFFIPYGGGQMGLAVKKTISLPQDLASEAEEIAREEGKTISAVIQDALKLAKQERLKRQFREIQSYWSNKAKEKGILTEDDLDELLQ